MKYTEVNPFTGKNIDEDAPANATGPSVAGTGDDSSVVVVRKKKKKDTLYDGRTKIARKFIEIGVDFEALEFNINVQFEIMKRASAVCLPDSVFYHACHAMKKPVDFVYFGRGPSVYERVKHIVPSEEKVVFEL